MSLLLKTCGYGVSTLSVLLLGIVAWRASGQGSATLLFLLLAGTATSICGMFLRWLSYYRDCKAKEGAAGQLAGEPFPVQDAGRRAKGVLRQPG